MKKIVLSIAAVAFVTLAVVNVNLSLSGEKGFSSELSMKNVEALAQQENQNNCYKIVSTCNCKKNGVFHSVSIKECEHYYNPVCGSTCIVTHCPSGTSC